MSADIGRQPTESYELTEPRTKDLTRSQIRKARITGFVLFGLAFVVMFAFAPGATGSSTFGLSLPSETIQLDPLSVPAQSSLWILATVLAFLGVMQFLKGFQAKSTIILGIAFAVFVVALMVWATAEQEFNLESMLVSTVARSTPIALGALSGILCERSGVVNIGIEGMLLGGAFTGVVIGSLWGGWAGLVAATALVCLAPPLMLALVRSGLVKASTLGRGRRYAIVAIAVVAGVVTPTVDVVSQVAVGAALWALFEITLVLCRIVAPERERRRAEGEAIDGQT